ncbi:MFS transporter [Streptomyces erythrochromogenes]|uniref:MFS transporter n=1 Tax=Streptomyces erythrochromogenes TaxID=285574 RepID=UPI0036B769AA
MHPAKSDATIPKSPRAAIEGSGRNSPCAALKNANYRWFFVGTLVSNSGIWMARVTQDWVILELTGSSIAVGISVALQFFPILLFGPFGGYISDRFQRRSVIFVAQILFALSSLFMAGLIITTNINIRYFYLSAFIVGFSAVLDSPSKQAFATDLVSPEQLASALSLNAINFQIGRLIGPSLGAIIIGYAGAGPAFAVSAFSFSIALATIRQIRVRQPKAPSNSKKIRIRGGCKYVRQNPKLLYIMLFMGVVGTFGFNYPIWLTAFADSIFQRGPQMYGFFNVVLSIGAVGGAVCVTMLSWGFISRIFVSAIGFGVCEVLASISSCVAIFLLFLAFVGAFGLAVSVTVSTYIQHTTEIGLRGRVSGIYMAAYAGGTAIGAPVTGWVTDTFGPRPSLLLGGGVCLGAATWLRIVLRNVTH